MSRGILKTTAALVTSIALLAVAAPANAAPSVTGEFPLPAGETVGTDNEIVQGPDGNMWVTSENNSVVRIKPDGSMDPFPTGGDPYGITVGPDNNLWASQPGGVVKIDPATGTATATAIGGGYADGRGITPGPDGRIWIIGTNSLTSIDPANPAVGQDVNVITTSNPKGMTTSSDGLLWFADGDKVRSATAAPAPVITDYTVGAGTQDVAAGLNGQVGFASAGDHEVGTIVSGGTPQRIPLDTSDPFGITFGADGAYWVARSSKDDLLRLAPDGTTSTLPGFSDAPNVGPRKVASGPNGTLWVTLDEQEAIGRVSGVEAPVTNPETQIDKAPKKKLKTKKAKAKAKFKFSSTTPGASFECALKKKKKPLKFKACASPKKYMLKPGKYTFQVRALINGVADATPAKHKFKVVEA